MKEIIVLDGKVYVREKAKNIIVKDGCLYAQDFSTDPGDWITTKTGAHIKLDENGTVTGGAGGNLNGKTFSQANGGKESTKSTKNIKIPVDKNTGKYIGRKQNGELFLTSNIEEAEKDPKKVEKILSSEKWARKNNISLGSKEQSIEVKKRETYEEKREREAREKGFSSARQREEEERKANQQKADELKEKIKGSFVEKYAQGVQYARSPEDISYDKQKMIKDIAKNAEKAGAEVIYKSGNGSNSVYLKKNDVEVRLTDHYLPQTNERLERGSHRWDKEEILTDGYIENKMTKIKNKRDMDNYIDDLFKEE